MIEHWYNIIYIYIYIYPPAPRRGATRLRRISSILYIWPPFAMESPLKGQSLVSYVSCLISHVSWTVSRVSWTVYCPPKKSTSPPNHHVPSTWDDPKITMKIHQFSSRSPRQQKPWKLVPRPPKIMKNRPWNHKKSNFYKSWFLQYLPCQMLVFPIPDTQI